MQTGKEWSPPVQCVINLLKFHLLYNSCFLSRFTSVFLTIGSCVLVSWSHSPDLYTYPLETQWETLIYTSPLGPTLLCMNKLHNIRSCIPVKLESFTLTYTNTLWRHQCEGPVSTSLLKKGLTLSKKENDPTTYSYSDNLLRLLHPLNGQACQSSWLKGAWLQVKNIYLTGLKT